MVIQSRADPVPLLLTRPADQAAGFAPALRLRFGDQLRQVLSPLMVPQFFHPDLPSGPFAALILTSQTGVEAFGQLGATAEALPGEVFCVGEQTARRAREAGLTATLVARDSATLVERIKVLRPAGKLLHLRGKDAHGSIAETLNFAKIDTEEVVTYAQERQPLSAEAQDILTGTAPVLVPLFSPRTAAIFASEAARLAGICPLFVAMISAEAALEVAGTGARVRVATRPDAASMLDTLALLLADVQRA